MHASAAIDPEKWDLEHRDANHDKVMIILLYGSWNIRASNSSLFDKFTNLTAMMKLRNPLMQNFAMTSMQVDEDEESYELCINDNNETQVGLVAPPELPAIVFVGAPALLRSDDDSNVNRLRVEHVSLSGAKLESIIADKNWDRLLKDMNATWSRLIDATGKLRAAPVKQKVVKTIPRAKSEPAVRIFIAGDRSQVGKSSICMGLLGALLKSEKYSPSDLAYIKPATQCEQTQLVEEFCKSKGIASCVPIGPIVYYKGFTRAFLKGEVGETSEQLLQKAGEAVDKLSVGKKVVIIDGVGYPSVGSITGTDNASVAKACGPPSSQDNAPRIPVPVLLIGKSGVGDAVDSFNINATYFAHRDVPVIGAIFNKLSLDGFYSLSNCKEAIEIYFNKFQPDKTAFGFIPEIPSLKNAREEVARESKENQLEQALETADTFVDQFRKCVNVDAILKAARQATNTYAQNYIATSSKVDTVLGKRSASETFNGPIKQSKVETLNAAAAINGFSLTRTQIEAMASAAGAAGG
jgi:hypothetical protein